jgi:hypothetical protein
LDVSSCDTSATTLRARQTPAYWTTGPPGLHARPLLTVETKNKTVSVDGSPSVL